MRYLLLALMFTLAASTAFAAFTDNGDGTITDSTTGLTWKKCLEGFSGANCATAGFKTTFTWSEALNLTVAGSWRVPNIKELQSIVDEAKSTLIIPGDPNGGVNPAIDTAYFPTPAGVNVYVWSSSPYTGDTPSTRAWLIDFNTGVFQYDSQTNPLNVRLVKDPQ